MTRAPTLTIVTINLNNAVQLRRTLASLDAARGRPDVELVFVDGASRDESVTIARPFYAPEKFLSEADAGVYDAMNKGLRLATARYVLWLNSGDEIIPESLSMAISTLESDASDLVCFGIEAVSCDESASRRLTSEVHELPFTVLHHQGACFLRSAAQALGGYDTSYKIVGDQDLIQRMFRAGMKISSHPLVLSRFYEGGLSFTRRRFVEEYAMQRRLGLISRGRHAQLLAALWVADAKQVVKDRVRRSSRLFGTQPHRQQSMPK